MRWAPLHPRQLVAIAVTMLALMCSLMLATAPDLGSLDFSVGSSPEPAGSSTPADSSGARTPVPDPAWISDPLASPVRILDPSYSP